MTISSTTQSNPYTSPGAVSSLAFTFRVFADADLVVQTILAGVVTTLVNPTHYSVVGAGEYSGGSISLTAAGIALVTACNQAILYRDPAAVQNTSFSYSWQAPTESALDLLTMEVLALKAKMARCIKTSAFDATTEANLTLPSATARASKALKFDGSGTVVAV